MIEIKVMIDGENVFNPPVKNGMRTYDNILEISTGQGDDFKEHYKTIVIDLSKQQELDSDPKAMHFYRKSR